jgi:V-type H+-transporting ATPase subunit H
LEKLPEPSQVRECALAMVQCKVLKQLEVIQQRKLDHDPELQEDLQYLTETLNANLQDVSSLDEYVTELRSGRLEWSPVHQSEKFWRENAYQFNEKNYEILKILVKLLDSSQDPTVLAVAAHDIGEYVRHYPRGKHVIEQLGGKSLVMGLLNHGDLSVRYHALIALQKIMVHNWEYLGKQLDSATSIDAPKQLTQKAK